VDTDAAFLEAFEQGKLANSAFRHREHIRLTWLYLRRDGRANVADAILQFATAQGAADRFHVIRPG
jgi:hypothetical protein